MHQSLSLHQSVVQIHRRVTPALTVVVQVQTSHDSSFYGNSHTCFLHIFFCYFRVETGIVVDSFLYSDVSLDIAKCNVQADHSCNICLTCLCLCLLLAQDV